MALCRILVVEDDDAGQEFYHSCLELLAPREFLARFAGSAEQALALLRREPVDILVLDRGLPGMNGLDLLETLRSTPSLRLPLVLMVTGRDSRADEILGLDSGADDFVAKPCPADVFIARLRALARRVPQALEAAPRVVRLGRLRLDMASGEASLNGRIISLHPKELALLKVFVRRPDIVHSPRNLWDAAWDAPQRGWLHTLGQTISALRLKFRAPWNRALQCRRHLGYLLDTRLLVKRPKSADL